MPLPSPSQTPSSLRVWPPSPGSFLSPWGSSLLWICFLHQHTLSLAGVTRSHAGSCLPTLPHSMPRAKSSLRTGPASFSSVFTAVPDRIERRKPVASLHQQEMDFFLEAEALCLFRRIISLPQEDWQASKSVYAAAALQRGAPPHSGLWPCCISSSRCSLLPLQLDDGKGSFSRYVSNDIVPLWQGRWEVLGSEARLLIRGRSRLGPVSLWRWAAKGMGCVRQETEGLRVEQLEFVV